jgi:hypothetical protein
MTDRAMFCHAALSPASPRRYPRQQPKRGLSRNLELARFSGT